MYAKIKRSEDLLLDLPEGWAQEGEKVSITQDGDSIIISKFVNIEIDIDNATFLKIAQMAHEKDITFNEMAIEILNEFIDKNKDLLDESDSN